MNYIPRLKKEYNSRVVKNLKEIFSYKSIMQVPKLQKIVLSRGVGGAVADKKLIEHAVDELTLITGQKAVATISKKDVASSHHQQILKLSFEDYESYINFSRD